MSADGRGGVYDAARATRSTRPDPAPASSPTGDGSTMGSDRSVPQLLKELSSEGAALMRQEVALAKAEMNEKVSVYQRNLVSILVGGVFLLAALLFAVWAVNTGVTALLAEVVGVEIAVWLSPLLIGLILAVVGWSMISKGQDAIRREGLTPHRTKRTLENDKRWAETKVREVKEDIKHG